MVDNSVALQVQQMDLATPLAKAAMIRQANVSAHEEEFKMRQTEMGSAARGLTPYINSPEFPQKWAEMADQLHQSGAIPDELHQKWRNSPSPLLLKSIISQTEGAEPDDVRKLRIAGIDPSSDEGKAALFPKAAGDNKFGIIGENASGDKQYGFTNDKTNSVTPYSPQGSAGQIDNSGLQGDDFLKSLPPARQNVIKSIVEGRTQLSPRLLSGKQGLALLSDAQQYDPTFDTVNYNTRNKTRAEFTTGKAAQNITALNTAIGHMSDLAKAYDDLGNSDGSYVGHAYNYVKNEASRMGSAPKLKALELNAHAVAEELSRVFKGASISDAEVRSWESTISHANGPSEAKAILKKGLDLLQSRLDALGSQYEQGMGKAKDPLLLLNPKAQEKLKKMRELVGDDTPTPDQTASDTTINPPPVEGAKQAKDGNFYVSDPQRPGKYLRIDQ